MYTVKVILKKKTILIRKLNNYSHSCLMFGTLIGQVGFLAAFLGCIKSLQTLLMTLVARLVCKKNALRVFIIGLGDPGLSATPCAWAA